MPLPLRSNSLLPALGVASLLAAGTQAYGQVIYSGTLNTLLFSQTSFDIDNNGLDDFSLTSGGSSNLFVPGSTGPGILAFTAAAPFTADVVKLTLGDTVGSSPTTGIFYVAGTLRLLQEGTATFWGTGSGNQNPDGYIGFEFSQTNGGPAMYGWMHLSLADAFGSSFATVVDYAYNATPGVPIQVGAIPEPAPAALILGAASLLAYRQRRRKAA